jgi:CheY-like chemotaxis protein
VTVARNGREAVDAVEAAPPALVLMDLRMPILDGTAALRRIRAMPQLASLPVIALTAHALEEERTAALADGFDAVITKPCLPEDLLQAVRQTLSLDS